MVSKTWCFTLNNFTEEDVQNLRKISFSRLVFGRELSKTGTPHLQGYVTLQTPQRLSGMKRLIPRAHFEIARSTEASIKYCKKDGAYEDLTPPARAACGPGGRGGGVSVRSERAVRATSEHVGENSPQPPASIFLLPISGRKFEPTKSILDYLKQEEDVDHVPSLAPECSIFPGTDKCLQSRRYRPETPEIP